MSATESHISGNMTVCLHLLVTNSNCFEPRGWRKVSKIRTDTFYTGNLFEYVVLKNKNIAIVPSKNDRHARSEGICHKKKYLKHDDVIKWKHFPRYWPFVRGIHRSPVNSPHKGHWRGALMFSLICVWINGWVNNREAGDLRRYRGHYDVIVMSWSVSRVLGIPELNSPHDVYNTRMAEM